MSLSEEEPDLIAETKRLCSALSRRLPGSHSPTRNQSFTTPSGRFITCKIPTKVLAVIGSLAWRSHDFAELCHELYERERVVPAVVLTRALMETTALLHLVSKKTGKAVGDKSLLDLDEFLIKCMSGNRTNPTEPDSPNILTALQHLEKEPGCDGYLAFYEALCEFAHPNAMGTFYAYADFDSGDRRIAYGHNKGLTRGSDVAFGAVFALEVFDEIYERILADLPAITELAKLSYGNEPDA